MPPKVRKAVFPAAGLGTRFLPATKAQPKEMLPLVDKPMIQYGVEEAVNSGVQNIIIVTGRGKTAIEDHFDVSFELEHMLESRNKTELLAFVRDISDMIDVSYVRQKEALGLGHAVLRARELVGDEPFAVVLSDDVIDAEIPACASCSTFSSISAPVLALMEVPRESLSAYGVVEAEPVSHNGCRDRLFRIHDMVEKPRADQAPSNLAIIGRYVLTPEIFSPSKRFRLAPAARSSSPTRSSTFFATARSTPPIRRHPLRRRRQARVPEGDGGVRLAPA